MTAITFDTLSTARRLREKGWTQEQAEALADEIRMGLSVDISHLATKDDLQGVTMALKVDLRALEAATKADIRALEAATKADLQITIAELKADMIKWMFGGFLTVVGMLVAVLVKLH